MAYLSLLLVFSLLGLADAAAVAVAMGRIDVPALSPLSASTAIHCLVSLLAVVVARSHPLSRRRPGSGTLALLAGLLCLLTPVLGCLVAAWMVSPPFSGREKRPRFTGIRFGNPLSPAMVEPQTAATPFTEPLTFALSHGHRPLQRLAVPRIRQISDQRALAILRDLNDQPDARTHLYAQAALSTGFERREQQIDSLRRAAAQDSVDPETLSRHERLGTALLQQARLNPDSAAALTAEASACYDRALAIAPSDAACLLGKAFCLIRLGDLEAVPDLYGRLCAVAGANPLADRLEIAYLAALGNWNRAAETAARLTRDASPSIDLGADSRQFWLTAT